ncbi:MAG: tRNA (uridine(54)-C5)-methyltransferase TrmA [Pseudomonadota bacterium]
MKPWTFAPERYDALFDAKCAATAELLAPYCDLPAQRYRSPSQGFRVRAEFRLWHEGDALDYVMFDPKAPREPVVIDEFPQALAPITERMPRLLRALRHSATLRRRVFQAEFLASRSGQTVVTLVYHRPLDQAWEQAATDLARELGVSIIGRSRKQKIVIGVDRIEESFEVGARQWRYYAYEQSFVQPNAFVNEHMLNWVWTQAQDARGDLLELYCGNGNFTLPLASCYRAVLATEVAKISTRAAMQNIELNAVENVELVRLSAEEVTQALNGARPFRRLQALRQPLAAYDFCAVFVDPPRQGLDRQTCELLRRFERIYYISCSPQSLVDNLRALHSTHEAVALAMFDQFPYTHHVESGVVLIRRST